MSTALDILCELVRIPSINPMGRELSGPEYLEHALTDHLEQFFGRLGLPCERHLVEPQRSNVIARLDGSPSPENGGRLLLWEAHQDTVPVDGMTIPPFEPVIHEGRLHGRGSCDVKGGMASMLAALMRLAEEPAERRPTIIMACTIDEEHGATGATRFADLLRQGDSPLIPRLPDAAIVAEPTGLDIVVAHKGVIRWRCHTTGIACHSAHPERGENAIYKMSGVLAALQEYAQQIVPTLGDHRLLGRPTLSVGTIQGGVSVNTVPDRCTIEIDRRSLPMEDPSDVVQQAIDYVAAHPSVAEPPRHDPTIISTSGLPDDTNRELADVLGAMVREAGGPGNQVGVAYGTNAQWYARAGVPTVVFGPGDIEQAHTKDEWIAIDQLDQAAEILTQFALRFATHP